MTAAKKEGAVYRIDRKGKLFICNREGLVLTAYQDGPHMSIGIGSNDPTLRDGDTITVKEAFERFARDIADRERLLSQRITLEPTQEQFNALFSLFYQSGWRNILDLLVMHNHGAEPAVVGRAFANPKRCTNKAGAFLRGLEKRRQLEGKLYAIGEYEDDLETVPFYRGNPRDRATKQEEYTVTLEDLP